MFMEIAATCCALFGTYIIIFSNGKLQDDGNKKDKKKSPSQLEKVFLYILTEHRSLAVTVFALPLSFLWNFVRGLRAAWVRATRTSPKLHGKRVANIVEQVRSRPEGSPMCTARPGWMSISLSKRSYKKDPKWKPIEVNLIDILHIDRDKEEVHVEPNVSIGELTRALLPLGYTLPIVPEMDDLTVGGLINGTGIESSSHRYGLFHEICNEYELCLGDGAVVVARKDNEYSDLFSAIPWSYGTLGLLLSAKIRIIPCEPYVKVTYLPHKSRKSFLDQFSEVCEARFDGPMFVEALAYSDKEYVLMTADFVASSEVEWKKKNSIGLWFKPWFYKHVATFLQNPSETVVEFIPARHYYHRHSQSLFWEMELMIPVGNHPLFRWVLGWLMPPKVSFLKLTQTELTRKLTERTHVAQDFLVPMDRFDHSLTVCHDEFQQIYPLWICPHDHAPMGGSLLRDPIRPDKNGKQMYVDLGVYGLPKCVHEKREEDFNMGTSMRNVMKEILDMGGFQMLYADVFNSRDEFETMFNHVDYRRLRTKYKADTAFKEVYDKMNVVH
mmetsp:Transcript_7651/g.11124  ORF Transcript_7651/g.11124 Transcript_7651/m.11124 type:complete len:554 (-) Transcript_7651:112-1773(-)|eukprot:CAMPEP_0195510838 /NCGR_PEP_ID=MMETSP0794_2-20130614/3365_1 /TAXON_ID=515487 /ORGANISM="Stephanopyxis turris, Strain CCMP 815" /LENGTH=553 /DNA_ID=CAMNT_0040638341 /DNA_START=63 /DNA_END=1724 /DNA_ORIENTATION=-